MKIGLISDSHGHLGRTHAAAKLLAQHDVAAVLHCGDIGTSTVLVELAIEFEPRGVPVYAVLGNVDTYNRDLYPFEEATGVTVLGPFGELTLDGHRLGIAHGHDANRLESAIATGGYEYVFHGHTHVARDEQIGATRVINPGAIYRAGEPSVAVLDLATGQLTYLPLADN